MFLWKILQLDKFEGTDFKYDNIFFLIIAQKHPNKAFLVPNETFSFFHEVLQLGKFEGDNFKYNNIIFKFQSQNTQIRHFWSQI